MSLALMDADVIAYSAARPAVIDWEDGDKPTIDMEKAQRSVQQIVESWRNGARCEEALLCFSDRSKPGCTFRYKVHPKYKAQRKTSDRPINYSPVVKYMKDRYDWEEWASLEGDDVLGILMTEPGKAKRVMVSIDKDMQTIPGWFFNPTKHKRPMRIHPVNADKFWMYQTLTGDSVDNYLGAPGIGPKAADKLLLGQEDMLEMWDIVYDAFQQQWEKPRWQEKFITDDPLEEAVMNARCARILRHGDYNRETNEVRLWRIP